MARVSNRPELSLPPASVARSALRAIRKLDITFISLAQPAFRIAAEAGHGTTLTHSGDNNDDQAEIIRALNDELRQNLRTGTAFMTAGVAALGAEAVARIVKTIAVYDDFCHANDPYEEHDFGSFEVDGQHDIFQDRLFRQGARLSLARSGRSLGHRARHHHHAGRRVLTAGNEQFRPRVNSPELRMCKQRAGHLKRLTSVCSADR